MYFSIPQDGQGGRVRLQEVGRLPVRLLGEGLGGRLVKMEGKLLVKKKKIELNEFAN